MFKRANKITALLVAAASVMSIVPAMAADSTSKLDTKDGTITNAVAYKDGKYAFEGFKSDDDNDGVYYNGGDKDKALDDLDDADLNGSYSDKYAFANDGSDQYLVDLTSGSVTDDQTPEDDADTAATKLKTALKKTDRYGSGVNGGSISGSDLGYESADVTGVLAGNKFDDTWYEYTVTPESGADGKNNTVDGKLYGFTNASGKYIDASNLANIYAYSSDKGKYAKIDEFSNDIDDTDDDTGLLATLVSKPEILTQDADNIYVKVKVQIYDENAEAGDIVGTTTGSAVIGSAYANKVTTHTYIQKIAKAQGDQKDDAYLPKTVTSYEVTSGVLDSGDADDAADAIDDATSYSVVNGQLLAIKNTATESADGNVEITSIDLKKDKVEFNSEPSNFSGSKVDAYLAEKNDSDDEDIDNAKAVDTDVDGNVWIVADGKIYKFTNNEFKSVYSVDSSLNSLSVYDEKSMIAWEDDGDIYTTVNEGKEEVTPAEPTTPAKTGWDQLANGSWNLYDATGAKVANKWYNDNGTWYFLKADGVMATGWYNDNGTWYFLKSSGAMATGWYNDNGTWYYLNASGAMLANTTVDGYTLNASGAWVK